ncbi:MAG: hypothetical protein ACPGED_11820 [Flavobacteriales bacterium]
MKNWSPTKTAWFTALPVLVPFVYFNLLLVIGMLMAPMADKDSGTIAVLVTIGVVLSFIAYFVVIGMYISHMLKNPRVDKSTRIAWVLGFVFMSMPILFLYWYKQILKKEEDKVVSQYSS